jgi:hypothetical protein
MKSLKILAILGAAVCGLSGCASTGITSTSSGGEAVPGEKVSGVEERVGAGYNGSTTSAQVKW